LQDENFYLLTAIEHSPAAEAALTRHPELRRLGEAVRARTRAAAQACEAAIAERFRDRSSTAPFPGCDLNALRWTEAERRASEAAAGQAFDGEPALRALVREHLRPSGYFALHEPRDNRALFLQAWREAHSAIDRAIRVYGQGEAPRSADIDSAIYPVNER